MSQNNTVISQTNITGIGNNSEIDVNLSNNKSESSKENNKCRKRKYGL